MNFIKEFSQLPVLVKNASGSEDDPNNTIEWYFNGHPWSSTKCPCCGKIMYRKKEHEQKHPIMVGAHVEIVDIEFFKGKQYVIPLCEECNNRKENLKPFYIALGWLKAAPHST